MTGDLESLLDLDNPSRRRFLKRTVAGLVLLNLSRPFLAAASGTTALLLESGRNGFLTIRQLQVLKSICARMIPGGNGLPSATDLQVADHLNEFFRTIDPPVAGQLAQLLDLFEISPLLFDFKPARFTRLHPQEQDEVLDSWGRSHLEFRRTGFQALKRLSMAGYYGQEATWKMIGYDGPVT